MTSFGLYIYIYTFWLVVFVLPAAVLSGLIVFLAMKCHVARRWVVLFFACLLVVFPPMKKVGTWLNEATDQIAISATQRQLDDFWYGHAPHYLWIGAAFGPDIPDHGQSSIPGEPNRYRLLSFRYKINHVYFIPGCVIVMLGISTLCQCFAPSLSR